MISSLVDLYNSALVKVGAQRVASPDEQSESRVTCSQFYQQSLDEVLSEHPWSCATSRATLAKIDGDTMSPFLYRYTLPVDPACLKVLCLIDAAGETYIDLTEEPWLKEGASILCNLDPCAIKFTRRVATVAELDTHVAEVLVYKLAAKIAFRLVQSLQIENQMIALYVARLQEARNTETFLSSSLPVKEKLWTDIR